MKNILVGIVGIGLDRGDERFGTRVAQHVAYLDSLPGYRAVKYNTTFDAAWSLAGQEGEKWIVVLAEKPIGAPVESYSDEHKVGVHTLVLTEKSGSDPTVVAGPIDNKAMLAMRQTMTLCGHSEMATPQLQRILELKAA